MRASRQAHRLSHAVPNKGHWMDLPVESVPNLPTGKSTGKKESNLKRFKVDVEAALSVA